MKKIRVLNVLAAVFVACIAFAGCKQNTSEDMTDFLLDTLNGSISTPSYKNYNFDYNAWGDGQDDVNYQAIIPIKSIGIGKLPEQGQVLEVEYDVQAVDQLKGWFDVYAIVSTSPLDGYWKLITTDVYNKCDVDDYSDIHSVTGKKIWVVTDTYNATKLSDLYLVVTTGLRDGEDNERYSHNPDNHEEKVAFSGDFKAKLSSTYKVDNAAATSKMSKYTFVNRWFDMSVVYLEVGDYAFETVDDNSKNYSYFNNAFDGCVFDDCEFFVREITGPYNEICYADDVPSTDFTCNNAGYYCIQVREYSGNHSITVSSNGKGAFHLYKK